MTEPIFDPMYWKERLKRAEELERLHLSIYEVMEGQLEEVDQAHKIILKHVIPPNASILDIGCGYGRLLTLLPRQYKGPYVGVDLSPDFIELARWKYLHNTFYCVDFSSQRFEEFLHKSGEFTHANTLKYYDFAVLMHVKSMMLSNEKEAEWYQLIDKLNKIVGAVIVLEFSSQLKFELITYTPEGKAESRQCRVDR